MAVNKNNNNKTTTKKHHSLRVLWEIDLCKKAPSLNTVHTKQTHFVVILNNDERRAVNHVSDIRLWHAGPNIYYCSNP